MTSEGFFLLINSLERYFQSTANKCLKKVDEERKEKKNIVVGNRKGQLTGILEFINVNNMAESLLIFITGLSCLFRLIFLWYFCFSSGDVLFLMWKIGFILVSSFWALLCQNFDFLCLKMFLEGFTWFWFELKLNGRILMVW